MPNQESSNLDCSMLVFTMDTNLPADPAAAAESNALIDTQVVAPDDRLVTDEFCAADTCRLDIDTVANYAAHPTLDNRARVKALAASGCWLVRSMSQPETT
jgi:hypothetical protein